MAGGLPAVAISVKFHQHRLSGYRAVRGRNLADLYLGQCLIEQPYSCTAVIHTHMFYGPLDFVRDYLGDSVPEPIWILLKQETVSSNANLYLAPDTTMPALHNSVFYRPDGLPTAQPTASKH